MASSPKQLLPNASLMRVGLLKVTHAGRDSLELLPEWGIGGEESPAGISTSISLSRRQVARRHYRPAALFETGGVRRNGFHSGVQGCFQLLNGVV